MRVVEVNKFREALVRSRPIFLLLIIFSILIIFADNASDAYFRHTTNRTKGTVSKPTMTNSQNTSSSSLETNLIDNNNLHWQMAGVAAISNSKLEVSSTDLAIVNQDGSFGQNNPPVNLYGTRYQVSGDFSITYKLSSVNNEIGLSLYGTPPIIEDEVRVEQGTLDIDLNGNMLRIRISDQKGGYLAATQNIGVTATTTPSITVTDQSGVLSFKFNGQPVGATMSDRSIFKSGKVWLGMDARVSGSKFNVDQLAITGLNGGSVTAVDTRSQNIVSDPSGFAALAQKKRSVFLMGAAVALGPMVSDSGYLNLLGNYNAVTTENAGKFQTIHPLSGNSEKDYNFTEMDGIVAMAQKAGMKVHGHTLVFAESNPAWVQEIASKSPTQLKEVIVNHIKTVVGHYKGQVASWDVINEPLADYDTAPGQYGLRKHIWYNAIGPDYIAIALRAAHEADPNATLWINEFGMESDDDRFADMVNLVTRLKNQGIPLTGVGFQTHIDEGDTDGADAHIDTNKLRSRMVTLNQLGLKVRISELDITNDTEYAVFSDVISVCIQQSNCEGVTMWGITDKYSSSGDLSSNGIYSTGFGLPWDEDLQPSPAVAAIKNAIEQ